MNFLRWRVRTDDCTAFFPCSVRCEVCEATPLIDRPAIPQPAPPALASASDVAGSPHGCGQRTSARLKMGKGVDIEHLLEGLEGEFYGTDRPMGQVVGASATASRRAMVRAALARVVALAGSNPHHAPPSSSDGTARGCDA